MFVIFLFAIILKTNNPNKDKLLLIGTNWTKFSYLKYFTLQYMHIYVSFNFQVETVSRDACLDPLEGCPFDNYATSPFIYLAIDRHHYFELNHRHFFVLIFFFLSIYLNITYIEEKSETNGCDLDSRNCPEFIFVFYL